MNNILDKNRIPKDLNPKFLKKIMVVPTGVLFKDFYFNGFLYHQEYDFEQHILENHIFIERWFADEDEKSREFFKQPIAYLVLINSALKKIFLYRRAEKEEHYTEKRLRGKYSIGLGGHIEEKDAKSKEIFIKSLKRELDEEVKIYGNMLSIRPIGYINDDTNEVGRVHFGILYLVDIDTENVEPADNESVYGKMMSINEIEKLRENMEIELETWSEIALPKLKELIF